MINYIKKYFIQHLFKISQRAWWASSFIFLREFNTPWKKGAGFKKSQAGQSLVELLVAIGLATLLLPAMLTGISASRGGRAQHDQRLQASAYLKQAQEAVRSIAQQGWSNVATNGTFHPEISGSSWILSSGTEDLSGLSLAVTISDAYRDSNGMIVATGGTIDPSTKKVEVAVSWSTPLVSSMSATSYFTRYNNSAYTETLAAEFSNGTLTNTQVTDVTGGEIKLINNNKAKWCTPAFSSATIDLPDGPPVAVAATANSSVSIPNDAYVATSPTTSNSIKMAYVNVTADTLTPTASLSGKFTMDASQFASGYSPQSGVGLDNNFKTNDVKYYTSSAGKRYALLATDLADKEIIVVQVNDADPDNDETDTGEFQDPVNNIYKYHTFFNTNIYAYAASDTGFRNPSANSAESSSSGDNNGFQTNATRAYSDNGSFAVDTDSGSNTGTDCSGVDKDKHRYYNYGFTLPSGATVDGVEVRLDAKVDSTTGSPNMCVQLSWDGGTTWTTAKTTNTLTTSEATYILGGATDNWGHSWSDTNFTNGNFRVRVINVASNISRDFSLDWAGVKVYYNNSTTNDYAPYGYGANSLAVQGDRGYATSGGYLYVFDLSDIDTRSPSSGLAMLGCRLELAGKDCNLTSPSRIKKYNAGGTGSNFGSETDWLAGCSDGGNIEIYADNDIFPVSVGNNTYVYVAVGGAANNEFEIIDVTTPPTSGSSLTDNTCGRDDSSNASWSRTGTTENATLDFNNATNTQEAANSVFAKSDGSRAYISSNGGIDGDSNGQPDSKQFYVINTENKSDPVFLSTSGSPEYQATSGFYYGASPNDQLYPKRSLTVLNGERVVLVGRDGTADSNDAQEYQVLDSSDEAAPAYCSGINFDQGFNDLTSVSEADNDNFVYMVANTTINELKIIEGGPDDAIFNSSGTFESQTFDAGSEVMSNRMFATSSVPAQTTLQYQVAVGDAVSGSCSGATYNFVGPDGTSSTFFSSSSELPNSTDGPGYENPGRCMRYKVYMTSTDQLQTPILYDFGFNYSQ